MFPKSDRAEAVCLKEEDDRREEGVKISALLRRTKAGSYP
jgi:hypothetical protein